MKGFFASLMLAFYLLAMPGTTQLLKLPRLVEHFIAHSIRDGKVDFIGFIKMHYIDAPVKDADYAQDLKLPFKTFDHNSIKLSAATEPALSYFRFTAPSKKTLALHHFTYSEHYFPSVLLKIWQPPKI